jgi:pimeloyl-ACP methyl ester carboxylesterase
MGDAQDIVTCVGHGGRRFHLVGHDWGGSLAWIIADRWPERIASLTMLSRPHPASFARALKIDREQPNRFASSPGIAPSERRTEAARRKREVGAGPLGAQRRSPRSHRKAFVGDRQSAGHGSSTRLVSRARRARTDRRPTRVPTLFIWGEADDTAGRIAAEGTAEFIEADYCFAPLPGIGHYAADQPPARISELLLDHLTSHPV